MTRIDLRTDLVIANAAAAFVMATGAVNWALPLGQFTQTVLVLTLAANTFIVPLLLLKHRPALWLTRGQMAGIAAGSCLFYAVVRSLFGITATPWAAKAMLSHAILVPLAVAIVYFAVIMAMLLIADRLMPKLRSAQ